jgi:hypothetical protein
MDMDEFKESLNRSLEKKKEEKDFFESLGEEVPVSPEVQKIKEERDSYASYRKQLPSIVKDIIENNGELVVFLTNWFREELVVDGKISKEAWISALHSDNIEDEKDLDEIYEEDLKYLNEGIYQWNIGEVYMVVTSPMLSEIQTHKLFEMFDVKLNLLSSWNAYDPPEENSVLEYEPKYEYISLEDVSKQLRWWISTYVSEDLKDCQIRVCTSEEHKMANELAYGWLKERVQELKESEGVYSNDNDSENERENHYEKFMIDPIWGKYL